MEMFNVFKTNTNDFKNMLQINGSEIYVNGNKKYGLISHPPDIKEFNDKYISTDFKTQRGDYVYYQDMYWMIMNQVGVPRAESYKGLMRQVEYDVVFNLYYFGETTNYLLKCPAIISRTSDYTQRYDEMIITMDSEIHVFVQDTFRTRKIIDLVNKSAGQIVLGQRNYDIVGVSIEKKGYLDITCKQGLGNGTSDYINNIYWGATAPSDWQDNYDLSLYELEGVTPSKPSAPNELQTNVGAITATIMNQTNDHLGAITFNWSHDASKFVYSGFNGYELRLFKDASEIASTNTTGLSQVFNDLDAGTYSVEINILFTTYEVGQGSLPQVSEAFTITNEASKPMPPTDYVTNVTSMSISAVGEIADDSDGIVTFTWDKDMSAEQYSGFVGYELMRTYGSNYSEQSAVTLDKETTSYQWTGRYEGQWSGKIRVKFVNGETITYGTYSWFGLATVQDNFGGSPW
ncbi:hypothetical protein ACEPPU_07315 [Priestia aryabhattai]|uniref:hypothetical protein n=1 Tax=Priestia aryabhattai TaxID=412384 RepID=UPI0035ABE012